MPEPDEPGSVGASFQLIRRRLLLPQIEFSAFSPKLIRLKSAEGWWIAVAGVPLATWAEVQPDQKRPSGSAPSTISRVKSERELVESRVAPSDCGTELSDGGVPPQVAVW